MVLFSVGTTENSVTRAQSYYMPHGYRFVCRMYYKAITGSDYFDVEGNTDQTAWLKVDGNVGNSLYWNQNYANKGTNIGVGGIDEKGNDYDAPAFYWQNRKEHAFLAWTNLNDATNITGGERNGNLKFSKDLDYKVYTGEKREDWITTGYRIYGLDKDFASTSEIREYVEKTYTTDEAIAEFNNTQQTISNTYQGWDSYGYQYQFGWMCKHTVSSTDGSSIIDENHREVKWYRYLMFFEKNVFTLEDGVEYQKEYDTDNTVITKLKLDDRYVAEAEVTNSKNDDGNYVDNEGNVITDPDELSYNYYETDAYGNVRYNENRPRYTFYYQRLEEKKQIDAYDEYPALKFDLTRGSKTQMAQQPDIAQALEIQAPVGATQESNRVNLYFKHQFSQIQVNIKNAADNSVSLTAEDILKVELLGVSEEGYIFTELDKEGKVHAAAYKEIDFSKYSYDELKENQFGTSFEMFDMKDDAKGEDSNYGYELGYLKSFNAITFGQLQAIRTTWKEDGENGYEHAATYRIPSTELMNLQSGVKYVWNIEIRRGTLAIIRTEIVDWELPDDVQHNGSTDGTIQN